MKQINEALGALFLMAGIVTVIYILARYTYLIKKAMIEKGFSNSSSSKKVQYIDIGCIVMSLGIGLLVSSVFTFLELSEDTTDLLIWGTILVFGAFGLLAAHWFRNKNNES